MAQVSGTTTDTRHLGGKAELTTNRQPPIPNNRVGPVIGYLDNRGYTLGYTLTARPWWMLQYKSGLFRTQCVQWFTYN